MPNAHTAEFWLETSADPHQALSLARRILEVRLMQWAHEIVIYATLERERG